MNYSLHHNEGVLHNVKYIYCILSTAFNLTEKSKIIRNCNVSPINEVLLFCQICRPMNTCYVSVVISQRPEAHKCASG